MAKDLGRQTKDELRTRVGMLARYLYASTARMPKADIIALIRRLQAEKGD